ncbi:tape measure protein [Providencia rettgeri]|uniref:tape measure protein n=1 Tax=Providencia rettgeri TaxID=587 RepID=UPI000F78FE57|nr:tape measure protein [Providencia rettgeri]MBV2187629.1 tape measure protein [Providencia rettgeri]
MAGSQSVGGIHYDVAMDIQQLLTAQRTLDQRLSRMESGFNQTSSAIDGTNRAMSSLSKVAVALTSYLSVQAVAGYADAWTVLNNKLSNSVREGEALVNVTERIFNISQETRSSLDATATLYARLERGTREYNTSAEDLVRLTTIINQGFIVSGATAQEAENAIIQLSQGIASGVLRGEEFNSVSEQGSRLMVALADSLGVGIGELRKMAAEGKLTTDVVVNGLLSQGNSIGKEFANTTATMSQSIQAAGNNLTKFFGESTTVQAGVKVFNSAIITLSENIDVISTTVTALGAAFGGRLVASILLSSKAKIEAAISARNLAIADAQATQSAYQESIARVRSAETAKINALAELDLARRLNLSAFSANDAAIATARLTAARSAAAVATSNYNKATAASVLSQNAAAQAATRASKATSLFSSGMALLGGPIGAVALAAGAIYLWGQRAKEAREAANNLADEVGNLTSKFDSMSRIQITEEIKKAKEAIPELEDALEDARKAYDRVTESVRVHEKEAKNYAGTGKGARAAKNLAVNLEQQADALEAVKAAEDRLSKTLNFTIMARAKLNGELLTGADLLTHEATSAIPSAANAWKAYGLDIDRATRSKQKFNAESLKLNFGGKKGDELKKRLERELALSKVDGEAKVKLQVQYAAEDAGVKDENAIKNLQDAAIATFKNNEEKRESIKTSKDAATAAAKEATEAEKLQKKITDLANATKVAELETKGLSREAAILEAVQSLGSKASEKQIKEITELASKEFDLKQAIKDREDSYKQNIGLQATRDQKLALEQLDRQLKANLVTEEQYQKRRAEINAEYSKKIAEENAKSVITPTQEMAGQLDPVQQLANENAQKLALIQEYVNQKVLTEEQGLALMNAANREYEQSRFDAMWGLWKGQNDLNNLMGTAIDSLSSGTATAVSAMLSGTQSAGDAMRNLANTALNAMIQQLMQMAVQALITRTILGTFMGGLGAIPNISSVASSVTSSSSIGGMGMPTDFRSYGGARYSGGPVDANKMYQVGEHGKPEIFKASTGKQYMIPGDNGRVISNKDMQGSGNGITLNIEFNDYSSGKHQFEAQASQNGDTLTVQAFLTDMHEKGPMHRSITQNTTATTRL